MILSTEQGAASPPGPSGIPAGAHASDRLLVDAAVAQLPAEYRAVLRRAVCERWTTAQIADDLRIAEATVKATLHFALRALRSTVQEMMADAAPQSRSSAAFGTAFPRQWDANLTYGPGAA